MTDPRGSTDDSSNAPWAVRMSGIAKSFGSIHANMGASLEVRAGEIHALVG